jgi:hypothetical protein
VPLKEYEETVLTLLKFTAEEIKKTSLAFPKFSKFKNSGLALSIFREVHENDPHLH